MAQLNLPSQEELDHKFRTEKLEAGWLGNIFGKGEESKKNIAVFIVFLLILVGIFIDKSFDFWKSIVLPVITLCLGYIFAKK